MKLSLFGMIALYLAAVFLPFSAPIGKTADPFPASSEAEESSALSPLLESYPVLNSATGQVSELSPVEYIKGVVAAEMPVSYGKEALKAQAVAAHSYALYRLRHQNDVLPDDPAVLQGYIPEEKRRELWGEEFDTLEAILTSAVEETIDLVLTYEDELAETTYYALSSGRTESAKDVWGSDIPYLVPVDSSWDTNCAQLNNDVAVEKSALSAGISEFLAREDDGSFSEVHILSRSESGMVLTALCGDSILSGRELRQLFDLPSANFTLSEDEKTVTFHCIGKGHGVGMSQFGAMMLANEGKHFEEILAHYYPGTALSPLL